MKKLLLKLILTILFISAISSAYGSTIIAATSGLWKTASTWTGGVIPATGDIAIIPSGVTVTYEVTLNAPGGPENWLNPAIYVYGVLKFTSSSVSQLVAPQYTNAANVYVFSNGTYFDDQYSNGFYLDAIMDIYMYSGSTYSITSGDGFTTSEFSVNDDNDPIDFNPSVPGTVASPGPNNANNPNNAIVHNTNAPPVIAPPLATTGSSASITASSATLSGSVYSTSVATTVTFDYGTSSTLSTFSSSTSSSVNANVQNGAATINITGLAGGTTYFYRVRGTNSAGATLGNISSFTTPPAAPATPTASAVTTTGFTLSWGGVTGANSYQLDVSSNSFSSSTTFTPTGTSQSVTGLSVGTTYQFRVRAVGSVGTSTNSGTGTQATDTPPVIGGAGASQAVNVN